MGKTYTTLYTKKPKRTIRWNSTINTTKNTEDDVRRITKGKEVNYKTEKRKKNITKENTQPTVDENNDESGNGTKKKLKKKINKRME